MSIGKIYFGAITKVCSDIYASRKAAAEDKVNGPLSQAELYKAITSKILPKEDQFKILTMDNEANTPSPEQSLHYKVIVSGPYFNVLKQIGVPEFLQQCTKIDQLKFNSLTKALNEKGIITKYYIVKDNDSRQLYFLNNASQNGFELIYIDKTNHNDRIYTYNFDNKGLLISGSEAPVQKSSLKPRRQQAININDLTTIYTVNQHLKFLASDS